MAQIEVRQQLLQLHDCVDLAAKSLWDYVSTDDAWKEVLSSIEDFNAEWEDVKAISDRVKAGRNRGAESRNRIIQLWGQEAFDALCPPLKTVRYMRTLATLAAGTSLKLALRRINRAIIRRIAAPGSGISPSWTPQPIDFKYT